jgi:hypothetical protein
MNADKANDLNALRPTSTFNGVANSLTATIVNKKFQ